MLEVNKVHNMDCFEGIKQLDDQSVDMVITSPPYWALRDYGIDKQFGLQPTFKKYVEQLLNLFDEIKRVLKDSGTAWINLGDTYYGGGTTAIACLKNNRRFIGFELNPEYAKICMDRVKPLMSQTKLTEVSADSSHK